MKVAVVGSRSLDESCYRLIGQNMPDGCSEVISGGARGIDAMAERYAAENGLVCTVIKPDYRSYERAAPLIRNSSIVAKADFVLILWDGASRGSLNVIETCMKTKKPYKIVLVT